MAYKEMWSAIDSKYGEAGVVDGCQIYNSSAGTLGISRGVTKLKNEVGTYHVEGTNYQVGTFVQASASGTVTIGGTPLAGNTVTVDANTGVSNAVVYTVTASDVTAGDAQIATNVAAALNANATFLTSFTAVASADVITITAKVIGTAGNTDNLSSSTAIGTAASDSMTAVSSGATLSGGTAVETTVSVASLANGFYNLYVHPVVDASNNTTGFELKYGAALLTAPNGVACTTLVQAVSGFDPGAANGSTVATVPEPNVTAGAFKMGAAIPDSDFFNGRSVKVGTFQITTNAVVAIDTTAVHRIR